MENEHSRRSGSYPLPAVDSLSFGRIAEHPAVPAHGDILHRLTLQITRPITLLDQQFPHGSLRTNPANQAAQAPESASHELSDSPGNTPNITIRHLRVNRK